MSNSDSPPPLQPPILPPIIQPAHAPVRPPSERAPTLYSIIALKFFVGVVLAFAGLALFFMRSEDLQAQFRQSLTEVSLTLGGVSTAEIDTVLNMLTPSAVLILALSMFAYGALSLIQGFGLIYRASWAAWLVIIESAIFVPIEIWDLLRRFSVLMLLVLIINIAICWYLLANRHRLFARSIHPKG